MKQLTLTSMLLVFITVFLFAQEIDSLSGATRLAEDMGNALNAKNDFLWADLAAHNEKSARSFYSAVFGWDFTAHSEYSLGYLSNYPIVGIYAMPPEFKQQSLPAFWMSYIRVDDVQKVVRNARRLGARIEFTDNANDYGAAALIRDPLGAGFTVIESKEKASRQQRVPGAYAWNELFVSDASIAIDFYTALFDWEIVMLGSDSYGIYNSLHEHIATIHEVPNDLKGNFEYWAVFFYVSSIDLALARIMDNGGTVLYREDGNVLAADRDGAAFYITDK